MEDYSALALDSLCGFYRREFGLAKLLLIAYTCADAFVFRTDKKQSFEDKVSKVQELLSKD